jgi:MYXO-CTERM domain-containing protein
MKRTLAVFVALIPGTLFSWQAGLAHADVQLNPADSPDLETPWSRPQATYVWQNPGLPVYTGTDNVHAVPGFSPVIYLNRCASGCQINPGNNNSINNTSGIPNSPSVVQPFNAGDTKWNQVVQCVRETYAQFGVQVVDQRPASGNYHMAIVAGRPQDVGMQSGVGGVSEFTCGYIPNGISFSFANVYGGSVDDICWTVAQETAHSWGLDHKFDNRDPMTYLSSGPSRKTFQNQAGSCGEFSSRQCQCSYSNSGPGGKMNSVTEILAIFGGSTPTPPMVRIDAPMDNETVDPGFGVRATIMDDIAVGTAQLFIDNQLVSTLNKGPFAWNTSMSLGQGRHTLKVVGADLSGTPAEATIQITIGSPCEDSDDCDKDTDACVDGRCVPGPGATGGLGNECADNTMCASGQCGMSGMDRFCVEACNPAEEGCPDGFTCLATNGTNGVCWPGGGGGCSTNGDRTAPTFILLGLVSLALVVRRRRR